MPNNDDSKQKDVLNGAAVGGAVGAGGGLLYTLLKEKPSLRKALENMLVGGVGGAAVGGGAAKMLQIGKGDEKDEASPQPPPKQEVPASPATKHMDLLTAAGTGYIPGVGPAVHGFQAGGLDQAARSGGRSALEALAGSAVGNLAASKLLREGSRSSRLAGGLAALAGSIHGSVAAADNFNDRNASR